MVVWQGMVLPAGTGILRSWLEERVCAGGGPWCGRGPRSARHPPPPAPGGRPADHLTSCRRRAPSGGVQAPLPTLHPFPVSAPASPRADGSLRATGSLTAEILWQELFPPRRKGGGVGGRGAVASRCRKPGFQAHTLCPVHADHKPTPATPGQHSKAPKGLGRAGRPVWRARWPHRGLRGADDGVFLGPSLTPPSEHRLWAMAWPGRCHRGTHTGA